MAKVKKTGTTKAGKGKVAKGGGKATAPTWKPRRQPVATDDGGAKAPSRPRAGTVSRRKGGTPQEIVRSEGSASDRFPDVTKSAIDGLVADLHRLGRHAGVDLAYQIGERVVSVVFGGDAALAHRRGPKSVAFTKLVERDDLPFGASTISRSIGVYEILLRRPELRATESFSLGHFQAVLSLTAGEQDAFLAKAEKKDWTAEDLGAAVRKQKQAEGDGRGRPALAPHVKSLRKLQRLVEGDELEETDSFVDELDADDLDEVEKTAEELRAWCEKVIESVGRRKNVLEGEGVEKSADE